MATLSDDKLYEVASRIREMREICGFTEQQMSEKTEVTLSEYNDYEAGKLDFPFTFIHKCSLAFGIGVNCGDAVVGNIGCEVRMDYTAIGDTVNTAARLESNAKRGQILISQEVYDNVKDRVDVTPIGEIPLKGKAQGVFIYQVDDVR